MNQEETFKTLVELKLSKIGETILNDADTDWQQIYSTHDFRAGELEDLASKYVSNALQAELYLQSQKALNKGN